MKAYAFSWTLMLIFAGLRPAHGQGTPTLGPKDGPTNPPTDLERVKVGDLAPDFTLESLGSGPVTLSSYRAAKNVVLVFYRGHW